MSSPLSASMKMPGGYPHPADRREKGLDRNVRTYRARARRKFGGRDLVKTPIYGIKEISSLLRLPKSTLRYWDTEGLIRAPRNPENGYREFSFDELVEISDIAFYRGLGIPVEDLKSLRQMTLAGLQDTLFPVAQRLDEEMTALAEKKRGIELKLRLLKELGELKRREEQSGPDFQEGMPDFADAVQVDYANGTHWAHYLQNPERIVLWARAEPVPKILHGLLGIKSEPGDRALWKAEEEKTPRYLECLVRINADDPADNDLASRFKDAAALGYRPRLAIGRYLATVFDGQSRENYKTWIEVE